MRSAQRSNPTYQKTGVFRFALDGGVVDGVAGPNDQPAGFGVDVDKGGGVVVVGFNKFDVGGVGKMVFKFGPRIFVSSDFDSRCIDFQGW